MARKTQMPALFEQLLRWTGRNSRRNLPFVVVVVLVSCLAYLLVSSAERKAPPAPAAGPGGYLLFFWNVENLFDDRDDARRPDDEPFDDWFSRDRGALEAK